ncbi:MAG TPA: hypothetical protein DGT23_00385 [Micromonosporaceae bacterium]|nr:hypothetical protein [Micromonosporaceae bacterium]
MTTSTYTPTQLGAPSIYGQPGLDQVFGQQFGLPQQQGQQYGQPQQFGYPPQQSPQFGQQQPFGFADPSIAVSQQLPQLLWQAQQCLVSVYQIVQVLQQLTLQVSHQQYAQPQGIGGTGRQFQRPYGMGW